MSARRAQLTGWWLFVLCAVCYLVAGWRTADPWSIGGSVLFLAGCFAFMMPLLRGSAEVDDSAGTEAEG